MTESLSSRFLPRRGPARWVALPALALVLVALAWFGLDRYRAARQTEGDYIYAKVERGDIEDLVTATGSLQPRDYVDVGAQVSGQLERIVVKVGDTVAEGDLLAEIDATQSEARVAANRASLKAQESQLVERRNALAKAERDHQRQLNLRKEDATTEEAVQNAETALISARQAISTLRAQIEQQRASMRVEEANLKYTRILAPMAGTVVSITAKQGQTLNTNQQAPTILRIADLSTMSVQTQVSEADVAKLVTGMRAYFTTLGSQGRRWYGTLSRVEPTPTVQNNVVLYNALFEVQNDGGTLLPQMTAQVFFVRAEARDVLALPMSALQQGQQYLQQQRRDRGTAADDDSAGTATDRRVAASSAPADGGRLRRTASTGTGGDARPAGLADAATPRLAVDGHADGNGDNNAADDRSSTADGASRRPRRSGADGERPRRPDGGSGPRFSPEQIEQFRKMRQQRLDRDGGGSGFGSARTPEGGWSRPDAADRSRPGTASGSQPDTADRSRSGVAGGSQSDVAGAATRQRRGTVLVKQADGKVVPREVVVGVTNRVHGEVLSGLQEGEEVVAGRRETEAPAASSSSQAGSNRQGSAGGIPGGGMPGGGFPGGGFPGGGPR